MVASNFEASLAFTRTEEGGNDDDPRDHGGRTSRGITKAEWDRYRASHPNEPADVWAAPDEAINAIYRNQYWNPYCDNLRPGLDLAFFDFAVNAGQRQAARCLQRALGVSDDGHIGMETLAAIDNNEDLDGLIHAFCERRRAFYKSLKQYSTFGKGWMARANRCERAAIKISSDQPQAIVQASTEGSAKANADDAKTPAMDAQTTGVATGGLGSAGILIEQVKADLGSFTALKYVQYILLALTIIGALYTAYSFLKQRKVSEAVA